MSATRTRAMRLAVPTVSTMVFALVPMMWCGLCCCRSFVEPLSQLFSKSPTSGADGSCV